MTYSFGEDMLEILIFNSWDIFSHCFLAEAEFWFKLFARF